MQISLRFGAKQVERLDASDLDATSRGLQLSMITANSFEMYMHRAPRRCSRDNASLRENAIAAEVSQCAPVTDL